MPGPNAICDPCREVGPAPLPLESGGRATASRFDLEVGATRHPRRAACRPYGCEPCAACPTDRAERRLPKASRLRDLRIARLAEAWPQGGPNPTATPGRANRPAPAR